jgi:hypothetical protein
MAVKGSVAKSEVAKEILNLFGEKAFLYNDGKEIRVNWTESGTPVQIKIALTAAKEAVEVGGDIALPGTAATPIPRAEMIEFGAAPAPQPVAEPTPAEKQNIKELMARLGL